MLCVSTAGQVEILEGSLERLPRYAATSSPECHATAASSPECSPVVFPPQAVYNNPVPKDISLLLETF